MSVNVVILVSIGVSALEERALKFILMMVRLFLVLWFLSALSHVRSFLTSLLKCLGDVVTFSNSHIPNTRFLLLCFSSFTPNLFLSICLKVFLINNMYLGHFFKVQFE